MLCHYKGLVLEIKLNCMQGGQLFCRVQLCMFLRKLCHYKGLVLEIKLNCFCTPQCLPKLLPLCLPQCCDCKTSCQHRTGPREVVCRIVGNLRAELLQGSNLAELRGGSCGESLLLLCNIEELDRCSSLLNRDDATRCFCHLSCCGHSVRDST
jgi:hypothetical protein